MSKYTFPPNYHNFLKDFIITVLEKNPDDLVDYAAGYFKSCKEERERKRRQSTEEKLADYGLHLTSRIVGGECMESEELWLHAPRGRRKAVAAPSIDPMKIDRQTSLVIHEKTQEQLDFIKEALKNIALVKNCNNDQLDMITGAMFEKKVTKGQTIITQGENGDNFYVVQKGKFIFHIEIGDYCIKKTLDKEGSFGELALLYECPRTATVIAQNDGVLWCLDQRSFKTILVTELAEKQQKIENIIQRSKVLSTLSFEERSRLVDNLETEQYENGVCIIKQEDEANCMYFLVEGQVKVVDKTGKKETEIVRLGPGDHFGELALVMKDTRKASVFAVGTVTCAVLEVDAFERLLGSYRDIIKRDIQDFNKERDKVGVHRIVINGQI